MDVKTLCLGVLYGGDATGYEIKKLCEEGPFSQIQAAGFGSIYPALKALCADGLVSLDERPRDERPGKKVYSITPAGRLHLAGALAQPPGRDRFRSDFWFILYFAQLLRPRQLDALIGARIEELRTKLAAMENCPLGEGSPGQRFTLGAGKACVRAELAYLEQERHVLLGEMLREGSGAKAADGESVFGGATAAKPAAE